MTPWTLVNSMTALRDQVGLAQARGTLRIGCVGGVELRVGGKGAGQLLQALGLLAHRAQGLLEHHLVEAS